ncbi:MAG: radical SAM protein [Candidatus Omnitrophica bacterium]|jgi:radical SAM superfamily enzyme YgiQ (UPF0313 family)|nr:radical SAM protein [Candidatus Omnitrophota bacterium]
MNILAINPWIVDFAAYDFWLKPYGFLVILTYLAKNKKIKIDYIDCLNEKDSLGTFGRGKYPHQIIDNPTLFKSVPRYFKRYGIKIGIFEQFLENKNPDYILITSSMTYWYPSIIDIVKILKAKFPKAPIILGGTYANLCTNHAKRNTGCNFVFKNTSLKKFFKLLNINFDFKEFYSTLPLYENFYQSLDYVVFRTSWGCPFSCAFCAIKKLSPPFFRINSKKIIDFILKYCDLGIQNFVLYDDAFLYENFYAKSILKEIKNRDLNINFHTPNALHIRFLDEELAHLLKSSRFINPHFGLETLNPKLQKLWTDKVNREDLLKGIEYLKKGGYRSGEFSVYLLLGYPNQNLKELKDDIEFINSLGARVSLAEFSPTPGTKIFEEFKKSLADPLLHNNSIFGFFEKEKIKDFWEIKNFTRQLNKKLAVE